ncbi:MAG: molybdopterin-dependent oxidoreductase [Bacteroidales bacterium]|jgi:isoquinoline 1-oxidoreductase|nr:molybdopterin-dependent oxidoreductase [Bacteroidales bacterium]
MKKTTVSSGIKRRSFIKLFGGGIFIFFQPWNALDLLALPADQARSLTKDYNAFLQIAEDGTVTCFTGKIEMGQGIITSLPQMMAEELNVPISKVKMIMGDTDLCPYDAGTWGSLTTRAFGPNMRAAAAEARAVLVEMASVRLGVPVSQLEVRDGVVVDTGNSAKSVTYAELAKGQKLEKYLDPKPLPEDYTSYTHVGKPLVRSDSFEKVTGRTKYTGDLTLPGMVHARILRPPSHGAKLESVDVTGAEQIDGVSVVREGDFIAVISENRDKADLAVVQIRADYSYNELQVNDKTVYDFINKGEFRTNVVRTTGDIEAAKLQCDKVFESEYHDPYLAHAPIETHTALARFEGEKVTVWASTQSPFGLQDGIVRELGMTRENVRVITPFVGGGFGGKAAYQQGIEAAKLARMTGKPVMLAWTRDEEFFYDTFHAVSVVKVRSGIDKNGLIHLWDYHVYLAGTRGAETIYDVPNARTTSYGENRAAYRVHPFATGPWRAPNNNTNTFARETQIDIMAAAAGIDPLEFRLMNLKDEKMIACLKSAAEKFGYTPAKTPSRRGIGIACGTDAGTWVAEIAEVEVDASTGKVKVKRVVASQDMGLCVNPQGSLIQMEGCITMALGYTLTEELKYEGGNIADRNFDTYQIPRFSWLPKIECVILDRKDQAPQGGGEPAIIAVGAAVGNAIFDATGARLFRVPFTPERVVDAIKLL